MDFVTQQNSLEIHQSSCGYQQFFFLIAKSIPCCGCPTVCLAIHLLKDIWGVVYFFPVLVIMPSISTFPFCLFKIQFLYDPIIFIEHILYNIFKCGKSCFVAQDMDFGKKCTVCCRGVECYKQIDRSQIIDRSLDRVS